MQEDPPDWEGDPDKSASEPDEEATQPRGPRKRAGKRVQRRLTALKNKLERGELTSTEFFGLGRVLLRSIRPGPC